MSPLKLSGDMSSKTAYPPLQTLRMSGYPPKNFCANLGTRPRQILHPPQRLNPEWSLRLDDIKLVPEDIPIATLCITIVTLCITSVTLCITIVTLHMYFSVGKEVDLTTSSF